MGLAVERGLYFRPAPFSEVMRQFHSEREFLDLSGQKEQRKPSLLFFKC